ncbi:hypothetical protein [Pseudomonas sp. EGD-AKN5]|uniref:hypothetical protein n=1 Tax=Pseudomonas sp. EGD-AKN5 TaxID=1524461 RepID=UPI0018A3631A|nr:hypothetical protein [Pseudomonas sp. EGD-AKN5]QOF85566.1 hypothetical protein IG194_02300 [Pseudomonas sp. ADPe]
MSRPLQNCSLAALKLFICLCMRADFNTGSLSTTYPQLMALSGMSRPLVARALKRLISEKLVSKVDKPLREGTELKLAGWEDAFFGKLPKQVFYDDAPDKLLKLREFEFSALSLHSLKVYLVIVAYRNRKNFNIATINYTTISLRSGVPKHLIPAVLNRLYANDLIAYKQADYYESAQAQADRTNRYLVRGLGDRWPAFNPEKHAKTV